MLALTIMINITDELKNYPCAVTRDPESLLKTFVSMFETNLKGGNK